MKSPLGTKSVSKSVLALYTRQLAVLFKSGVSLMQSLQSLTRGEHEGLNQIFADVAHRVEMGSYFSASLARYPACFPSFYVGLVQVGEKSGSLQSVMTRLADYLESRSRLERQIWAALTYPFTLALVSIALLTLLTVYILPMMEPLFAQVGGELPWITRVLLLFSRAFWRVETWASAALVAVLLVVAYRQISEAESESPLRRWRDSALLRFPVLGKVIQWATVAQILRLFSLMIGSGLEIRQCLRTLKSTVSNKDFQDALTLMEEGLMQGETLAEAMNHSPVFPAGCVSMVKVAEESGRLAETLEQIANLYDDYVETLTTNLVQLLEPLLLCVSSLLVGVVCLATLLPWLQLITRLTG